MTTLDKFWTTTKPDSSHDNVDDNNKAEPNKTVKNSEKTTKNNESTMLDDDNKPTPLFSITLRFKIFADSSQSAHSKHLKILKTISDQSSHCQIFSKTNDIANCDDGLLLFDYHQPGKQRKYFITVHRVISNMKYYDMKKNKTILETLKEHECYLNNHDWSLKEWDIISIGFLSGASPRHQSKDTIKQKFELIEKTTLKYHLHARYLKATTNGTHYDTYGYEIQCKREDAKEILPYIHRVSKELNQTLVRFQWKYTNSTIFVNGMKKQNAFIESIRTIPIYGIVPKAMSYMYNHLIPNKSILGIGATSKTAELGRWNIYTTTTSFETTTKWLQKDLSRIHNDVCKHNRSEVPTGFKPEVRFNTTIIFEDQDINNDMFLDEAAKSVSPYSNAPTTTKTWASIARSSNITSTITHPSETSATIQKLSESIERICRKLDTIEHRLTMQEQTTQRLSLLLKKQEESTTNTSPRYPKPTYESPVIPHGKENLSPMDKLSKRISELETRTNSINTRKLNLTYDQTISNKQQDVRKTPTKFQS